jgi:hypothetical protein
MRTASVGRTAIDSVENVEDEAEAARLKRYARRLERYGVEPLDPTIGFAVVTDRLDASS